jgi:hypothetical protein
MLAWIFVTKSEGIRLDFHRSGKASASKATADERQYSSQSCRYGTLFMGVESVSNQRQHSMSIARGMSDEELEMQSEGRLHSLHAAESCRGIRYIREFWDISNSKGMKTGFMQPLV